MVRRHAVAERCAVRSVLEQLADQDAANVKTPTLFFAGESDIRVPMAQSIEMYRALMSLKVPTRLYVGPREGHRWSELRHSLFKANAELEWFESTREGEATPGSGRRSRMRGRFPVF